MVSFRNLCGSTEAFGSFNKGQHLKSSVVFGSTLKIYEAFELASETFKRSLDLSHKATHLYRRLTTGGDNTHVSYVGFRWNKIERFSYLLNIDFWLNFFSLVSERIQTSFARHAKMALSFVRFYP